MFIDHVRTYLEAQYALAENDEVFDACGVCHADPARAIAVSDAIALLTGCEPMGDSPVYVAGRWPLQFSDAAIDAAEDEGLRWHDEREPQYPKFR